MFKNIHDSERIMEEFVFYGTSKKVNIVIFNSNLLIRIEYYSMYNLKHKIKA